MNFYFWQNTNSLHQSAFFNKLAKLNIGKVHLIVTESLSSSRLKMGWEEPVLEGVEVIYLSENKYSLHDLIVQNSGKDNIHVFSGINAFKNVHTAFKCAIKHQCVIGIFTEPLDFRGKKGTLRKFRGYYHKLIYGSHIKFILTTGLQGVSQFEDWGYNNNKIFEWAYTVENSAVEHKDVNDDAFKIMFAGSLILRKGYDILIQALIKIKENNYQADFYCLREDQLDEGKLIHDQSGLGNKLRMLPFLKNNELRKKMTEYDLFILPSRHDGWGAVVSESIMEGTPVLVSKKCGSSTLVSNESIGRVIHDLSDDEIAVNLQELIKKGKVSNQQKINNRDWANKHISGQALAYYFKEVMEYLTDDSTGIKPVAPWKSSK